MMTHCRFLLLALAACTSAPIADPVAAPGVDEIVSALTAAPSARVLWVGAHPDDELMASPLLAALCHAEGLACDFLVMTDGGQGNCVTPTGCAPRDLGGAPPGSLGALRLAEEAQAASAFRATLHALALPDAPAGSPAGDLVAWSAALAPGTPASIEPIIARVAQEIAAARPDLLVTFDPRHGTTCHPDHRATALAAITAASRAGLTADRVLMVEVKMTSADPFALSTWVPTDPALLRYDAGAAGTWPAWPATMAIHRSQFTPAAIAGFEPATSRVLHFARLSDELVNGAFPPSPYDAACP